MPRKKRTIVDETLPDAPATGNVDDDLADIICVLTKVYKLNAGSKSFCFQTQEPVDEVSVQAQYPTGGKFLVIEYNSLNQPINTTHLDIEPKPIVTQNGNGIGVGDIRTQMLMEELTFSRNMMLQMLNGLFSQRQGSANTPIGELVGALQGLRELAPSGNTPVDLIVKGMELGMKANGGAPDWKSQLVETAKEVVPQVMQAFNAVKQQPQGQPMIQTTPEAMFKQGLAWIKPQILSGMQPQLAVGMLVQFANNPEYQPLLGTAIQGDINNFIAVDPEIANEPYKTWFTVAIQMLKEWYAEQSNPTSDNDGGIGDSSDAEYDEEPSGGQPTIKKVV